jgi:osmoprotectant transport system permease protein
MFADGYQRTITIELWAALGATMVLALVLDLIIYTAGRAATPWAHRTREAVP